MKNLYMKKITTIGMAVLLAAGMTACGGAEGNDTSAATDSETSSELEPADGADTSVVYEYRESQMEHDKEESVYVKADAYGTPTEITVTTTLKNPGENQKITDFTTLTDIKNKNGDEEYTLDGAGNLVWENHGEDIQYDGTADADKELPVTVKVSYYLDDKEVTPEELAGATGRVRIRFDYTNNTGSQTDDTAEGTEATEETTDEIIPFVAVSGLMLSQDVASDITVTNCKIKSMDDNYLIFGYAAPGVKDALDLDSIDSFQDDDKKEDTDEEDDSDDKEAFPDYMEVSFDAKDFELDFTATMISNGLLTDMDTEKMSEKVDDLADGFRDLYNGTSELTNALQQLSTSGNDLVSGAESLQGGLQSLNEALSQIPAEMLAQDPTLAQTVAAVAALAEGSGQLTEGIRAYTGGVTQVYNGSVQLRNGTYKLVESADDLKTLRDRIENLKTSDSSYENFGGIEDGKTGSVYFLVETAEIKPED